MSVMTWRDKAACRDKPTEWFHPPTAPDGRILRETPKSYRRAKEVCDVCPVAGDCLEYALTHADDCCGYFGNMMAIDRMRLRRTRRRHARQARVEFRRKGEVYEIC